MGRNKRVQPGALHCCCNFALLRRACFQYCFGYPMDSYNLCLDDRISGLITQRFAEIIHRFLVVFILTAIYDSLDNTGALSSTGVFYVVENL